MDTKCARKSKQKLIELSLLIECITPRNTIDPKTEKKDCEIIRLDEFIEFQFVRPGSISTVVDLVFHVHRRAEPLCLLHERGKTIVGPTIPMYFLESTLMIPRKNFVPQKDRRVSTVGDNHPATALSITLFSIFTPIRY